MKRNIEYWLIWKFLNDSLTWEEEQEFNSWLKQDKNHKAYVRRLKKQRKAAHENKKPVVDSNKAWDKLFEKPKRKRPWFWPMGIAASILVVISFYFGFIKYSEEIQVPVISENISFEPGVKKATLELDNGKRFDLELANDTLVKSSQIVIRNTIKSLNYQTHKQNKLSLNRRQRHKERYNKLMVPRGGEYFIELSDGTKVWINSESVLRYPEVFYGNERRVQLIGEAFFEVKTDSLHPFIVTSGDHSVRVYGTSFNIKSYEDEKTITTTLVEGRVKVCPLKQEHVELDLSPGFQTVFEKETANLKQVQVNTKAFTSWKDGRFFFRSMTLETIVKELGRWYDVDFIFRNENVKQIEFNGNIKRYDNIQTILNQLTKTNEITFTAYGKIIYVD